jgi:hypothetical protein
VRGATLPSLGDVTIVLSKKRRNAGPKHVKLIVTNVTEATAGPLLRMEARRWGVALSLKELQSGLPLGDLPVTKDPARGARSVTLSVLASLRLVRLYGYDEGLSQAWSLFKLKERFAEEIAHEAVIRPELQWQRKLKRFKHGASYPYDNPSLLSKSVPMTLVHLCSDLGVFKGSEFLDRRGDGGRRAFDHNGIQSGVEPIPVMAMGALDGASERQAVQRLIGQQAGWPESRQHLGRPQAARPRLPLAAVRHTDKLAAIACRSSIRGRPSFFRVGGGEARTLSTATGH